MSVKPVKHVSVSNHDIMVTTTNTNTTNNNYNNNYDNNNINNNNNNNFKCPYL